MAGIQAIGRAPRMTVVNTVTGDSFKPQYNPSELEEAISLNFARQQVPGLSHEVMQFVNTGNRTLTFDMFFQLGSTTIHRTLEAGEFHHYVRSRLREFAYPRASGGLANAGPPRALLVFPSFVSLTCYLTDLTFQFQRFNSNNDPVAFTATTTWEEVRETMRLSEQVQGIKNE